MAVPSKSHKNIGNNQGVAGFEPATSWSQTRRDDRATLHPEEAERQGLEPWRPLPVDRLAICLIPNDYSDSIYVLVDETKRSWHAGASYWKNVNNINFSSIGIEIVNLGYTTNAPVAGDPDADITQSTFYDFPKHQIDKVAELARDIIDRYKIEPVNVLAHSDIAPQRKHDPGPKFPWKRLYEEYNIGAWYEEVHKNMFISQFPYLEIDSTDFIRSAQQELGKYGYEIKTTGIWDEQTKKVITAFQYHFRPERYDGILDAETWAILKALNLKYRT